MIPEETQGQIDWTLKKDSCPECSPHIFTQTIGCTNGSFSAKEFLPEELINSTVLNEIYILTVELTPTDSEGNPVSLPVEDTLIVFSSNKSLNQQLMIIKDLPEMAQVTTGQVYALEVSASGSGLLTYEWFKDSSVINGATGNSLIFPSIQETDAGGYKVKIGLLGKEQTVESKELDLQVVLIDEGTGDDPTGNEDSKKIQQVIYSSFYFTGEYYRENGSLYSKTLAQCPSGYIGLGSNTHINF